MAALVADTAPLELRGTAYGAFNLFGSPAQLATCVLAGALWDALGLQAILMAGAGFTALAPLGTWLIFTPAFA